MLKITISQLLNTFPRKEIFNVLVKLAKEERVDIFLVGGTVRDILLNRRAEDVDLLVTGESLSFARILAERLKGRLIELKEEKKTLRVVKKYNDAPLIIDINQASQKDICQSLKHRDFTINAMGLNLNEIIAIGETNLIDCYSGLEDLNKALIRYINPNSLKADPLRMLRAFRLKGSLDFNLNTELLESIEDNPQLILQSAGERISNELYLILNQPDSYRIITQMDECSLLQQLFPEIILFKEFKLKGRAKMDLWQHSLRTLMMMDNLISRLDEYFKSHSENINEHLQKKLAQGRNRLSILKLAALLHDLGKPETYKEETGGKIHFIGHEKKGVEMAKIIASRLRLSHQETNYLTQLIYHHLRPHFLLTATPLTQKAIYRFFRKLGEESLDCILLFIADSLSYHTEDELSEIKRIKNFSRKLVENYFAEYLSQEKIPRLINGNEIMDIFNLKPGKLIGQILEKVAEAQALGMINSKTEALQMVNNLLQQNPTKNNV